MECDVYVKEICCRNSLWNIWRRGYTISKGMGRLSSSEDVQVDGGEKLKSHFGMVTVHAGPSALGNIRSDTQDNLMEESDVNGLVYL